MKKIFFYAFALFFGLSSCGDKSEKITLDRYTEEEWDVLTKTLNLPEELYDYSSQMPAHFSNSGGFVLPNQNDVATLGRVLFYDKKLSANNTVSCASCHSQADAFADKKNFSEGFAGEKTKRNAFALGTVANFEVSYGFNSGNRLFWDERAFSIEEQCQLTISDPIEMGMDLNNLSSKLQQEEYYRILFKKAFHVEQIDNHLVFNALAQFIKGFNTTNTRFDEGLNTTLDITIDFPNFSALENQGKSLYVQNCSSCHGSNHITTITPIANNGLEMNYTDKGIGALTQIESDEGVFKVPLLRNVALTAPYMHDGRFQTLEDVLNHYSTTIVQHNNLHPFLRDNNGNVKKMNFSQTEKNALIAFLNTLTDDNFTKDKRFSDPFK
jgi:cytochrome c peroxidase